MKKSEKILKKEKSGAREFVPKKQRGKLIFRAFFLLVWTGASIIFSQLVIGYALIWIIGRENFNQPVWTGVYAILSYALAFLLIAFVPFLLLNKMNKKQKKYTEEEKELKGGISRSELGLSGLPTWTDIGLAPIGLIVSLFLAWILVTIFSQFSWFDPTQTQEIGFNLYATGFDRIIAFVSLIVVAPVAEEMIFRGWLYQRLKNLFRKKISNKVTIILSTFLVSLLFALIHGQWNVGVNVFAMSIVLCGLREITGTIYAGILMHMLKNGIAFYLLFVLGIG